MITDEETAVLVAGVTAITPEEQLDTVPIYNPPDAPAPAMATP